MSTPKTEEKIHSHLSDWSREITRLNNQWQAGKDAFTTLQADYQDLQKTAQAANGVLGTYQTTTAKALETRRKAVEEVFDKWQCWMEKHHKELHKAIADRITEVDVKIEEKRAEVNKLKEKKENADQESKKATEKLTDATEHFAAVMGRPDKLNTELLDLRI